MLGTSRWSRGNLLDAHHRGGRGFEPQEGGACPTRTTMALAQESGRGARQGRLRAGHPPGPGGGHLMSSLSAVRLSIVPTPRCPRRDGGLRPPHVVLVPPERLVMGHVVRLLRMSDSPAVMGELEQGGES
jgi:hypothetical protein